MSFVLIITRNQQLGENSLVSLLKLPKISRYAPSSFSMAGFKKLNMKVYLPSILNAESMVTLVHPAQRKQQMRCQKMIHIIFLVERRKLKQQRNQPTLDSDLGW